jgi:hypothetical protein
MFQNFFYMLAMLEQERADHALANRLLHILATAYRQDWSAYWPMPLLPIGVWLVRILACACFTYWSVSSY